MPADDGMRQSVQRWSMLAVAVDTDEHHSCTPDYKCLNVDILQCYAIALG